jgi:hemolysin D
VTSKDIGFVHAGQSVQIKIDTFPYTKYGTVPGVVTHISEDAIQGEKLGLVYAMRVRLERETIRVNKRAIHLTPGMALSVEVKTGRRRVVEYF